MIAVATLVVAAILSMYITALNLALRNLSFSRLARELEIRRRQHWLELYREGQEDYVLSTAITRLVCTLVLVLAVVHLTGQNATLASSWLTYYGVVFLASGILILIFGVAIPQAWAKYAGEALLSLSLPIVRMLSLVSPLVAFINVFDSLVRRLSGVPKSNGEHEAEQMEQDVLDAVTEAELHGAVDEQEKAMIESVMELDETTAEEIMTPRTELVAISKQTALDDLKAVIKQEGHSRIPVYDENIDQILGLVYAKDLLHVDGKDSFELTDHLREVPFVPESKSLRDLLREFQTGKTHAAIVLDEYGGTAGLVTIEDILEELVGEITDEYEQPEPEPIVRVGANTIEVDSRVHVDEINDQFRLSIPDDDDYETIGGFVFSTLGRIPGVGDQLSHEDLRITILDADNRRIKRLRIEHDETAKELNS